MKKAFPYLRMPISIFHSLQLSLSAGGATLVSKNVVEDEDESTRASGRGQSPRLVQSRKNRA